MIYRAQITEDQFKQLCEPARYIAHAGGYTSPVGFKFKAEVEEILDEYGYHSYCCIREHGLLFYQFAFRDERALELFDPMIFKLRFG